MSNSELARWDCAQFDGPAVLAAPTVQQAIQMDSDVANYASVRTALLWRGALREGAPPGGLSAGVPSTSPTLKETPE